MPQSEDILEGRIESLGMQFITAVQNDLFTDDMLEEISEAEKDCLLLWLTGFIIGVAELWLEGIGKPDDMDGLLAYMGIQIATGGHLVGE